MYDFAKARSRFLTFPEQYTRTIAIDTETTGLHLNHGAMPFMVSATWDNGESLLWQAEVDPYTRQPTWATEDLEEIAALLQHDDWLYVMTNKKFDTRALSRIIDFDPYEFLNRCHETIGMHHELNNKESHALKDAAAKYCGIPATDEADLLAAVKEARREAGLLGWAIASSVSVPTLRRRPSKGWGVMDYWLPRQMALHKWRTSPAFEAYQEMPKRKRVPYDWVEATSSAEERVAIAFGTWSGLIIGVSNADLKTLKQFDGWEWHPPEVSPIGVHPWHTLCPKYCSLDTLRTIRCFDVFEKALKDQGSWERYLELQINCAISYEIEERGVTFNTKKAKVLRQVYSDLVEDAWTAGSKAIHPMFTVNLRSPDQVREILYGKHQFGLPVTRLTINKKNRDAPGKPTIDKDFLSDLIGLTTPSDPAQLAPPTWRRPGTPGGQSYDAHHKDLLAWHNRIKQDDGEVGRGRMNQLYAFCAAILAYKKTKINIQQIDSFLLSCLQGQPDGFATLFSSINPYGTKSKRQSGSNPNPQNISKGGKSKAAIAHLFKIKQTLRALFGPATGREWWSVDYTQLQLVIFAFMCKDDRLIRSVLRGEDLHDAMARIIFSLPIDPSDPQFEELSPSEEQRGIAKNVNFGFLFGAQEAKINQTAGMPGLYDLLCNKLPTVVGFLEAKEWEVKRRGYVLTMGGSRLYVPEATPYAGSVYAIQGTEGEIVKRASYGVQDYLDRRSCDRKMFITIPVHDELNFDAELGFGESHIGSLCSIMEDAAESYGVPAKVVPKLCLESWAKGTRYEFEEVAEAVQAV